jgi:hypothetical protein
VTGDRQNVRQAVASYFGGAQCVDDQGIYYQGGPLTVYGLGTAYPYLIKGGPPDAYFTAGQAPGVNQGAIMSVYLQDVTIGRIAIGGPTSGYRQRTYRIRCAFEVISEQQHVETSEAFLDTLIDQWLLTLYADRTLGTSSNLLYPDPPYFGNRLIQEAGERPAGIQVGEPGWDVARDRGRAEGGVFITFDAQTVVMA